MYALAVGHTLFDTATVHKNLSTAHDINVPTVTSMLELLSPQILHKDDCYTVNGRKVSKQYVMDLH